MLSARFALLGSLAAAPRLLVAGEPAPVAIGNSTVLFAVLDLVESHNATQTVNPPPFDSAPVIKPDSNTWEKDYAIGMYSSAVQDGGKIGVWYTMRNRTLVPTPDVPPQPDFHAEPILTAYAESTDGGRTFSKPTLRQCDGRALLPRGSAASTDGGRLRAAGTL